MRSRDTVVLAGVGDQQKVHPQPSSRPGISLPIPLATKGRQVHRCWLNLVTQYTALVGIREAAVEPSLQSVAGCLWGCLW